MLCSSFDMAVAYLTLISKCWRINVRPKLFAIYFPVIVHWLKCEGDEVINSTCTVNVRPTMACPKFQLCITQYLKLCSYAKSKIVKHSAYLVRKWTFLIYSFLQFLFHSQKVEEKESSGRRRRLGIWGRWKLPYFITPQWRHAEGKQCECKSALCDWILLQIIWKLFWFDAVLGDFSPGMP